MFPSVLVFCKPDNGSEKKKKKSDKVWFYEVRAYGFDPDKISGGGRPETPGRNDIPDLLIQWKAYKDSGFKKPPGVEAGSLLEPGSDEPRCWWAHIKRIEEENYNLVAGRYKPQIAKKASEEDPAELIGEVLAIEKEITSGLEKLLKEVNESRWLKRHSK